MTIGNNGQSTIKLTESCKQLQQIDASIKQGSADLIVESKEKLEIAVNEVKQVNSNLKAMYKGTRSHVEQILLFDFIRKF